MIFGGLENKASLHIKFEYLLSSCSLKILEIFLIYVFGMLNVWEISLKHEMEEP